MSSSNSTNKPLHHQTVRELSAALHTKQVSATELAQHFLLRSKAHANLGTYVAQNESTTLAQAQAADVRIASGKAKTLDGAPLAHKDIFVTRDFPSTAASKMLANYHSPFDATVVHKLAEAGTVTLGKLSCDEFAMGSANQNTAVAPLGFDAPQPVRNPWNTAHVPGGSSGGSAAAVAAGLTPAATGTDTGGSIRQPASFCGITGIKPTYGRVSRYGMIAFASSLDQGGIMARTADDCALLLSHMVGGDLDRDSTSLDRPAEDYTQSLNQSIAGLRIGVPKEFFGEGVDADVQAALQAALKEYEKLGAKLVDVTLPLTELSIPVYYIIAPAEASANLERFDGVKFGFRAKEYGDLQDMYAKTRTQGFGAEVKQRIMIGTYVLSHGYYDAYYIKSLQIRRLIANDFQQAFQHCDVIAGPVAPSTAWKIGDDQRAPLADYLADIFTLPASLAGLPGMSVPAGFGANALPIGLQLIGNYFAEGQLLNAAHQFQQATDFHQRIAQGY